MLPEAKPMIIAVDIGATKTLVASFKNNGLVREDKFATSQNIEDFLADLLPLLKAHAGSQTLEAICIAIPGRVDHRSGSIVRCGNLSWHDIPLRHLVREQGFDCPFYLENDANLAGLAEAHAIHPIPQLCLYLTVSTGIGAGIIVNGKIEPALGNSEPGHMRLRRGENYVKWEQSASGRALVERTGMMASKLRDEALWHDHAERVAQGMLAILPALQPSIVVIGGGVGGYFERYWKQYVEEILHKEMSEITPVPPIIQAEEADKAVIYGCNIYARQHLGHH